MSRLLCLLVACGSVATGVKLSSYDQGAKFDKCISISDFEGKTLDDDITLVDRDGTTGCCPEDSIPGVRHTNAYVGPQIVCGFKSDGTVKFSTGSSNSVKTCTYNQCYVWKQGLPCKTADAKQRLNGCCAATGDTCKSNACDFKDDCKNYASGYSNVFGKKVGYCTTYHKNYKMEYTSDKTDDQKDNKLQIDKVYVYTACSGGSAGSAGSSGSGGSSSASASTRAAAGLAAATSLAMGLTFAM